MPEIQGTEVAPGVFWPLINVTLEVAGQTAHVPGIVDSGADSSIIPAEFLDGHPTITYGALSVSAVPSGGAGGAFETRDCPGSISWRGTTFCSKLIVAEPDALPYPLLGRDDFFVNFVTRFNWNRKPPSMKIDPVDKKKF